MGPVALSSLVRPGKVYSCPFPLAEAITNALRVETRMGDYKLRLKDPTASASRVFQWTVLRSAN